MEKIELQQIPVEKVLEILQAQLEVLKNLTTTFVYIPAGSDITWPKK